MFVPHIVIPSQPGRTRRVGPRSPGARRTRAQRLAAIIPVVVTSLIGALVGLTTEGWAHGAVGLSVAVVLLSALAGFVLARLIGRQHRI